MAAPANRSETSASRVAANLEAVGKVWGSYMATYLTPEEKGVATPLRPNA